MIIIIIIVLLDEVDDVIHGSFRRAAGFGVPLRRNLIFVLRRLRGVGLDFIPVDSVIFSDVVAGLPGGQRHIGSHRRESVGKLKGLHIDKKL
jgi:hypothetical protein